MLYARSPEPENAGTADINASTLDCGRSIEQDLHCPKSDNQGLIVMEKSVTGVFDPSGFSNVDGSGEKSLYVTFLEQTGARLRALSRARYPLLELRPGNRVLDRSRNGHHRSQKPSARVFTTAAPGSALYGLFFANGLQDVKVIPTPLVANSLLDANALLRLDAAAPAGVQWNDYRGGCVTLAG